MLVRSVFWVNYAQPSGEKRSRAVWTKVFLSYLFPSSIRFSREPNPADEPDWPCLLYAILLFPRWYMQ